MLLFNPSSLIKHEIFFYSIFLILLCFLITFLHTHVIVKALFIFPIMVFRHFQRLHKGKYIDTLLFYIFENLCRWPHVANICFNSLRQWRKFCQKLSLPSRRGRDLESFFQIHVSELKSFVHLFTRTLVRGTQ